LAPGQVLVLVLGLEPELVLAQELELVLG
jgi:nitrate/nitrite transporter NarK